ncbi:MFS general substrate transporter [Amniculicola lignicola CBS 123094]|uniref:MFS general substrate transporter n=1 Tax=Amniculicola lignicola CBS 123094 TaxID=1392246 RepID=A0A6A5WSF1_9PLEO|nr:MFS general substrate transporter [Amniculicola lignicola CBS 123094]
MGTYLCLSLAIHYLWEYLLYKLMVGIASAAICNVLEPISEETGLTLNVLNQGTGYTLLSFGWGCLIWQPPALQFGKRPMYLLPILATLATQVWTPHTKTNGQWIANKIMQGFVGAPIESMCEISVTDISFTHERGTYIGLYALLLAGSNSFVPIIARFINDSQGWQWVLYWCAIFCDIGFVVLFFFTEETHYVRHTQSQSTPIPPTQKRQLKTYANKIKLFQKYDLQKLNQLKGMMNRPLIFLTFPVSFYPGFSYGSKLVWFNVLNTTASLILGGTYNFAPNMVGVAYVSPLVDVAIGPACTGWLGDWFVIRKARKNNGIIESEHRLWLFTPSRLLILGGLILWGVGAAQDIHWLGPGFPMGVIAMTNTFIIQLSIAYCIGYYRAISGEAIITVILVPNTMSFAIGYGITPWVTDMGLQNCFITARFVVVLQVCTALFGAQVWEGLRRKSLARYSKFVEEMARAGIVH